MFKGEEVGGQPDTGMWVSCTTGAAVKQEKSRKSKSRLDLSTVQLPFFDIYEHGNLLSRGSHATYSFGK